MPFDDLQTAAFGSALGGTPADARKRRAGRGAGHAGRAAEERVRRWYEARGATVLAERWRPGRDYGGGEVDLIVRHGGAVAFVEVKARRTRAEAANSITPAQWRRLEAAALRFMMLHKTGEADLRFDVALCGRDGTMEVIENARMM
jgi:putative endonuclease